MPLYLVVVSDFSTSASDNNSEYRIFMNYTSSFFKGASLTNLFTQISHSKQNGFWIKTDGLGGVKSKHVGF